MLVYSDYPEGLSSYKLWRTKLNQFHCEVAHSTMLEAGYSATEDGALFTRVQELLLKKTLARPPLPSPLPGARRSLPLPRRSADPFFRARRSRDAPL